MTRKEMEFKYQFLAMLQGLKPTEQRNERIIELKREIRRETKRVYPHIVHDDGMDGYIILEECPDWCKTVEDVDEWFMEYAWMECRPSQYDCTGQAFTSWYKPVKRQGKWFAYHSVCYDV